MRSQPYNLYGDRVEANMKYRGGLLFIIVLLCLIASCRGGTDESDLYTRDIIAYITMKQMGDRPDGLIKIRLFDKVAPKTVANFVKLVGESFYDGLTFHRVVPHFVIQGGDPTDTGKGGPGYTIPDEFSNLPHIRGAVAMARSESPHSAGSQFYIVLERAPHIDGKFTIFGMVIQGMDVADHVEKGDIIESIRVGIK